MQTMATGQATAKECIHRPRKPSFKPVFTLVTNADTMNAIKQDIRKANNKGA
jgi:hypothetical protein